MVGWVLLGVVCCCRGGWVSVLLGAGGRLFGRYVRDYLVGWGKILNVLLGESV